MRPRLADLFCKAGGATKGYQRAGFYVVGVDIEPQPNYCGDEFVRADALDILDDPEWFAGIHAVHASPPCQAFTVAQVIHGRQHPDLLTPTRERLRRLGLPWVIENVPGAPMRPDFVLCGSQFGLRSANGRLVRHRWFECSFPVPVLQAPCSGHDGDVISVFGHGGHVYHGVEDWRDVMGIDWMTRDELAQAIPPAFTEFIGTLLLASLERVA